MENLIKKCTNIKIDGKGELNYRIWEHKKKKMTYFSVNFPDEYGEKNIYLKDIISEEVGMKFCMALMKKVLTLLLQISLKFVEKHLLNILQKAHPLK